MRKLSRRDFLRTLVAGAGAVALNPVLAGCQPQALPTQADTGQSPTQVKPAQPIQISATPCADSASQPCENPTSANTTNPDATEPTLAPAEPAHPSSEAVPGSDAHTQPTNAHTHLPRPTAL